MPVKGKAKVAPAHGQVKKLVVKVFSVSQAIAYSTIPGTYDLPMIVSDDQGRAETIQGTNAITVSRRPNLPPMGHGNPRIAIAENLNPGEMLWYNFIVLLGANSTHYFDISTLKTNILSYDTMIGLHDIFGNLVATNDDWDSSAVFPLNRPSMLTFGQRTLPRHYAPWIKDAGGSRQGNLLRGL